MDQSIHPNKPAITPCDTYLASTLIAQSHVVGGVMGVAISSWLMIVGGGSSHILPTIAIRR